MNPETYIHWLAVHVIQTSLALVGVALSGIALWDAIHDVMAVRSRGLNGLRLLLAKWHVRNEVVRLLIQLILGWVGIGSVIMQVPFGLHDIGITVIILFATLANRIDRNTLFDIDYASHHVAPGPRRMDN